MIRDIDAAAPEQVARAVRRRGAPVLWLGGEGCADGWGDGPLVAIESRVLLRDVSLAPATVTALAHRLAERRRHGGTADTGLALVLGYDAGVVALEVERATRFSRDVTPPSGAAPGAAAAARADGAPHTSLPRERYLEAVRRVKRHIGRGDIYQANLCQRFESRCVGDPFELHVALARRAAAPRAAYVEVPGLALSSISPETFVRGRFAAEIETFPIKGTRPRGASAEEDRRAAEDLRRSRKDHAELLMIVDLERNDLGRVCRVGSIETPELGALRSFTTVHHLVGHVRGRLRPDAGLRELLTALFPGGSITGAPKRRAMELLSAIEPAPRGYFTGSLFWLADDGSFDSSILIRSATFEKGTVAIGAGGGIVADSDPEAEWRESNHKARALTRALGFEPEEAR